MSDLQRAYETIRAHLIKQGKPAIDPVTGSCFYRHNGLMCAVGCLIKDEAYSVALEDNTTDDVGVRLALRASGWAFKHEDFEFLHDVQATHDRWKWKTEGVAGIAKAIDRLAEEYGLTAVTGAAL